MTHSKKIIIKLAAIMVGTLLFLTFFSNTIFSLNLPGVVVGLPHSGIATRTFRAEGVIDFPESMNIHVNNAGRIHFAVGRGDAVAPGDVLFTLHEDTDLLLERLQDEQGRLERILINLASAESDLAFEQSRLAGMSLEDFRPTTLQPLDLSRFDSEERRLEAEIERAEADYATYQILYEAGAIPRITMTQSADRIATLQENLQRNEEERQREIQNHERLTYEAADTDRQTQEGHERAFILEEQATRHRIVGLGHTVRLLRMDEQDAVNTLERLYTQAEAGGLITVYAEYYGVVREIPGGLESGASVEINRLVMRLGLRQNDRYVVAVYFPDTIGRYVNSTLRIRINIPGLDEYALQGVIQRTSAEDGRLRAEVRFTTDVAIAGGERAVVIADSFSQISSAMLPNSAIREDSNGYYILVVDSERNTLLGYSYYAIQRRITLVERGDNNSAIRVFPEIEHPVVIISDRSVVPGGRVRLVGDQ